MAVINGAWMAVPSHWWLLPSRVEAVRATVVFVTHISLSALSPFAQNCGTSLAHGFWNICVLLLDSHHFSASSVDGTLRGVIIIDSKEPTILVVFVLEVECDGESAQLL